MASRAHKAQIQQNEQQDSYQNLNEENQGPAQINIYQAVQISSDQAERYLQYLRKKVTHQSKDPFSLPFLNLKFQQLNSWKGATEQLNLQSKVYGMRVDNCHDNTMKLLNQFIRNQQQEIINQKMGNRDEQIEQKRHTLKPCFHLENADKISVKTQSHRHRPNNALWKTIFKKCQHVSEFQLNCIELSNDLTLKVDPNDADITFLDEQNTSQIEQIYRKASKCQSLTIFQEIQTEKKEFFQEIQQIKARFNAKRQDKVLIQNDLDEVNNYQQHYLDDDMLDYYSKLQQDQKEQYHHISFDLQKNQEMYQDQNHKINFYELIGEHENNQRKFNLNDEDKEDDSDYQNQDEKYLFQPYNDIECHTVKKNTVFTKHKNQHPTVKQKKNVQGERILFNQFHQDKRIVFTGQAQNKSYYQKNNLVPINLITLYESRNPFKKIKYFKKGQGSKCQPKMKTIYDYRAQLIIQINQQQQIRESMNNQFITPFNFNPESNIYTGGEATFESYEKQHKHSLFQHKNSHFSQSKQKALPIKILKTSIKNELHKISHDKRKNSLLYSQLYKGNENNEFENMNDRTINKDLGLKYLKGKMENVDPLDIFVAMLHIAYEEQIVIRSNEGRNREDKRVCDLIMEENK